MVLGELENRVDAPRDEFLCVGFARARFLAADPMLEVASFDVLLDTLTAALPGIVADSGIGSGLPKFRG